LSDFFF